jgi:hypothetical protein
MIRSARINRETCKAPEPLGRRAQIRCHLLCASVQLAHLHFERLPFHLLGILRAVGSQYQRQAPALPEGSDAWIR